jgi:hypothetical protein
MRMMSSGSVFDAAFLRLRCRAAAALARVELAQPDFAAAAARR